MQTVDSAPEPSRDALKGLEAKFGMVLNKLTTPVRVSVSEVGYVPDEVSQAALDAGLS